MGKPAQPPAQPAAGDPLAPEELAKVLAVHDRWPYPAHDDGWVKAHNALRMDMKDLDEALTAVVARLKEGRAVEPWMVSNLQKWWTFFENIVEHHHKNEEDIAFPEVSKWVTIPQKMSSDHVGLLKAMNDVSAAIKALKGGRSIEEDTTTFTALRDQFSALRTDMEEHLKEEEDVGLPLLRKHMCLKEWAPVEARIVKGLTPQDMGWFLRPFPDDASRRKWMTEIAKIPGFVQSLILLPAAKKFRNRVAKLALDVKAGQIQPPEATNCFGM